jgi:hypothetical protein
MGNKTMHARVGKGISAYATKRRRRRRWLRRRNQNSSLLRRFGMSKIKTATFQRNVLQSSTHLRLLYSTDRGGTLLRNVGENLQVETPSCPAGVKSSWVPMREPPIYHIQKSHKIVFHIRNFIRTMLQSFWVRKLSG